MAGQIARTIARQSVKALFGAFVKRCTTTPEQNSMQGILCTPFMKDVKFGKHFNAKWIGDLVFQNPAVYAYVAIKHHFKSLGNVFSVNLAGKLVQSLQTNTSVNINEVAQRFGKVIDPIAHAYTFVPDFLQYEVIRKRVDPLTGRGRAWSKAYDKLCAANARGQRLSLPQIAAAVKLVEIHLKDCTSPEPKTKTAAIAKALPAEDNDAAAGAVEPKPKQAKVHTMKAKDAKIKELKAYIAECNGPGTPGAASGPPRGTGGVRGGTRGGGAGPGARGGARREWKESKFCNECKETHWGSCLKDRVKETRAKLAREEEELRSKSKGKEDRTARQAKALPEASFELNESDSEYPCVLQCPGNDPTVLNVFFGAVAFSRAEIESTPGLDPASWFCMDTGAN
eukprot:1589959-Rhodomonas_salina.1